MNPNDWRAPHPVWIVGHRGAPHRGRENTVESFDWAEAHGVDAVELDVRQTRDGEAVVFHDEEIPIGSERIRVRQMASIDVRGLLLDSDFGEYRIPTLDQVFHRYGTRVRYVVELKVASDTNTAQLVRRVAGLVGGFGVGPRVLLASFDAEILRKAREAIPEAATSFLFDRPVALPAPEAPTPLFPPCDAVGPRQELVTPDLVRHAGRAGLSVHPWTVDDPDRMRELAGMGVASLTTNDPELAQRSLAPLRASGPPAALDSRPSREEPEASSGPTQI
jgi:glycerophosphoryl diester phosphodiesterase